MATCQKPGAKVSRVEAQLRETIRKQRQDLGNTGIMSMPIKQERQEVQPLAAHCQQPIQWTRKNVEMYQQQTGVKSHMSPLSLMQHGGKQSTYFDNSNVRVEDPVIHNVSALEICKLKETIKQYESSLNKMIQEANDHQITFDGCIKEMQSKNEALKSERVRMEHALKQIQQNKEDDKKTIAKLRCDNDYLLNKVQKQEQDLSKSLEALQYSDSLLEDMKQLLEDKDATIKCLLADKENMTCELDGAKIVLQKLDEQAKVDEDADSKYCFVSSAICKVLCVGSFAAILVAYLLQGAQAAAADDDCEYDAELLVD